MKYLISLCLTLVCHAAVAGPRVVKNGGDVYAIEFTQIATEVQQYLYYNSKSKILAESLKTAIQEVTVESTEASLKLKGLPKDALNYPLQKYIVFNRLRWNQIAHAEKPVIVLHEYLGIMNIDDTGYKMSRTLLEDFSNDKATVVKGPFLVYAMTNQEITSYYYLQAQLLVENYAQLKDDNSYEEVIRLLFKTPTERKAFELPLRGTVISVSNNFDDDVDPGLYITVLEPVQDEAGNPLVVTDGPDRQRPEIQRRYFIYLRSDKKSDVPTEVKVKALSNTAG